MSALAAFVTGRRTQVGRDRPLDRRRRRALAARRQARRRHERRDGELPARGGRVDQGPGAAQGPLPGRRDDDRPDRLPARGRPDRRRQGEDRARRAAVDEAIPVIAARAGAVQRRTRRPASCPRTATPPTRSSPFPLDFDKVGRLGQGVPRDRSATAAGGLEVYVTGDLGLFADFEEVFGELDTKLLLATVLLVLILLGAIYRAPLIAVIPIVVVALAYQVANGFIYLYADAGNTVNSNATSILVVLMFGVGTDYCLLLVSRYREELHRVEDKHEAMARALRRAGPALLASGCTVIAAMLVLLLADTGSTNALGPVSAIGVGVGAARRPDAAAGAADDRRPPRLLAAQRDRRLPAGRRPRCSARGSGGASATACCSARGSRSPPRGAVRGLHARPARLPGGLLDRRLLQEAGRERRRLRGARRSRSRRARSGRPRSSCSARAAPATDADVAAARERVGGDRRRRVGRRAAALRGRRDREDRRHLRRRPLLGGGARARGHAARPVARPARAARRRWSARAARSRRTSTRPPSATCA